VPISPPVICMDPSCRNVSDKSYCLEHRGREGRRKAPGDLPTTKERGYGWQWRRFAKAYLQCNPWCVDPEGVHPRRQLVQHCDHIKPVTGADDPLFFEEINVQGLCIACHNRKTIKERQVG